MSQPLEASLVLAGVVLAAIILAAGMDRFCDRIPRHRRQWAAVALTLLSIPAVLFGIHYLHVLPEMQWLYEMRSMRASELLLALPLSAAVAWSGFLNRPLALCGYAAAVCILCVPFAKPILRPLDRARLGDQWQENACLQSTESTCGPASAATLLRHLGFAEASEATIAREAMSTASGTEAWYLARAIRSHGATAEFQFGRFPGNAELPGILGVRLGSIGHFIAILSRDGDRWIIADPLNGEETLTTQEMNRRYRISGFFLHIDGTPHS